MKITGIKRILKGLIKRFSPPAYLRDGLLSGLEKGNVMGRHRLSVQVQTVSACNGKCYFCPYLESWQRENPGRMDDDLYRRIIEEVSSYKVKKFCPYLENEPLMDRKIFDRIEYGISRLDFSLLEISTNAALLDAKKRQDIIRIFPKVPHEIWISFHGADKESYEYIMGLDFEKSRDNVLALVDEAQRHDLRILIRGAGSPRKATADMPNWFGRQEYEAFWKDEFKKAGFKRLPVLVFFTYHDRAGSISRNEVNFKHSNRNLDGFYCPRLDQWLHFLYTGEMILCCMDYHRETVFGDISAQGLYDILGSSKFTGLVRKGCGASPSPESFICKRCISPGG